jgi:hypothetical protein
MGYVEAAENGSTTTKLKILIDDLFSPPPETPTRTRGERRESVGLLDHTNRRPGLEKQHRSTASKLGRYSRFEPY